MARGIRKNIMRTLNLLMTIFLAGCSTPYGGTPEKAGAVVVQAQWEYVSGEKKSDPQNSKRSKANRYPCQINDASCHMDYLPLRFPSPRYPKKALDQSIEGDCIARYSISATGVVEDPEILTCDPVGFFEGVTIRSILAAEHLPRVVAGKAVRLDGAKVQYNYTIGIE
jgi:hypothetical protein